MKSLTENFQHSIKGFIAEMKTIKRYKLQFYQKKIKNSIRSSLEEIIETLQTIIKYCCINK